jgi:hypothetical protein
MDYTNLIAILLPLFAQYGPQVVKSVADLIHGNPRQTGETDAAYVARINTSIDAKLAEASANDAKVAGA